MKLFNKEGVLQDIVGRIKRRDFSGNTGLAIKNSTFQFLTNFVSKLGTLLFTVIIARLLMPELFGLYSLAFSTVLLFATISDFGVGNSIIKFVSKVADKKNLSKARSYLSYLWKVRFFIILILIVILLASAKFISSNFYNKPIFLALIAGALYVLFYGIVLMMQATLQSFNKFKEFFFGETIFQISRVILVSLAVLLSIKFSLSNELILFFIFLALGFCYMIVALFLWFFPLKKIQVFEAPKSDLSKKQKKGLNKFLVALSAVVFSGLLFGYIDRVMLGHFVAAEFIGFYTIALSFVSAASALAGFGNALFPIFSRVENQTLEKGLKKSINLFLIFAFISISLILIFAEPLISIVYGKAYLPATNLLRLLSLSFLVFPLSGLYTAYFTSKGKPYIVAGLSIMSKVINVILAYILITSLLKYGDLAATFGAGIAMIISQFFYIFGLVILRKRNLKWM